MGQNIKSLAACIYACVCVWVGVLVCVCTGIGGRILRKRLEIEVQLQWDTNRK